MNRLSLTIGLVAMDLGWAYPWAVLLALWSNLPGSSGLLSSYTILALLLFGAWTTHLLGRRVQTSRGARLAVTGLAGLAALVAVRSDLYPGSGTVDWLVALVGALAAAIGQLTAPVVAFAYAMYLWWRGVRLGSQTPGFTEVEAAFRWGIARLAAFGLIMAVTTRPGILPTVEAETTPFVVGFFFVSLITLALGRLESLRTRTRRPTLNTQWLAVLIAVAGAVILLALLLGQLLSFDLLLVATRPLFDLLGTVLLILAYIVVIPLAFVIQWLVYLVLSLVQPGVIRPLPQPEQPADVDTALQRFLSEQLRPEMLVALKAAGAVLVLGIALLLVARMLVRWRPSSADADATNEERDALRTASQLRAILLNWLRRIFGREQRAAPPAQLATTPSVTAQPIELSTVRQLYAELLRQGAAAGAARASATTPDEHLASLVNVLTPEDSLDQLTRAYVRERYAEMPLSADEVASLSRELGRCHMKGAVD